MHVDHTHLYIHTDTHLCKNNNSLALTRQLVHFIRISMLRGFLNHILDVYTHILDVYTQILDVYTQILDVYTHILDVYTHILDVYTQIFCMLRGFLHLPALNLPAEN
jgi:hypothetical protein